MDNWHEHIDDYINGKLADNLLIAFEKEMEVNASLKAAVENYADATLISEGLLEVDMLETLGKLKMESEKLKIATHKKDIDSKIKNLLKTEDTEPISTNSKTTKSYFFNLTTLISAAAIIGIILFAGWWIMEDSGNSLDKEKIIAEYFKPINEDATKSLNDTIGMTPFEKGKHLFTLNQFEESEKWLKIYLSEISDKKLRSVGHFWLGAVHLEQWEVDEARESWRQSEVEGVKKNLELIKK